MSRNSCSISVDCAEDKRYHSWIWSDWISIKTNPGDFGFNNDCFIIQFNNENIGYISYDISRTHDKVTNVDTMIIPKFLGSPGIIWIYLFWLNYIFNVRKYRLLRWSCTTDNKSIVSLCNRLVKCGAARQWGMATESVKDWCGKYHSVFSYEMFQRDFNLVPNNLIEKARTKVTIQGLTL